LDVANFTGSLVAVAAARSTGQLATPENRRVHKTVPALHKLNSYYRRLMVSLFMYQSVSLVALDRSNSAFAMGFEKSLLRPTRHGLKKPMRQAHKNEHAA